MKENVKSKEGRRLGFYMSYEMSNSTDFGFLEVREVVTTFSLLNLRKDEIAIINHKKFSCKSHFFCDRYKLLRYFHNSTECLLGVPFSVVK